MNKNPHSQATMNSAPTTPADVNGATPAGSPGIKFPPPAMDDPGVRQADRKATIAGIVVALAVVAVIAVSTYLLLLSPARTANIRDIVIIMTALIAILMSIAIGTLLVILIYRLQELIHFLRGELVPLMKTAQQSVTAVQETANTVRGTTTFVSDKAVKPVIKAASFVSGIQQMAKVANSKMRRRAEG